MEKQIHWGSGRQGRSGSSRGCGEGENEEMERFMELREGMSIGGEVGEGKRKGRGEKKREVGSGDDIQFPVEVVNLAVL